MDILVWADEQLSKDLPVLRACGENQDLEYMESFPQNVRELAKEIAAFATSNAGTILIGVSNTGDLIGLEGTSSPDGRDGFLRRVEGICRGTIKPAITPIVETMRLYMDGGASLRSIIDRVSQCNNRLEELARQISD